MTQASECVGGLQNKGRFPYSLLLHAISAGKELCPFVDGLVCTGYIC
jgi:hypothetical protein